MKRILYIVLFLFAFTYYLSTPDVSQATFLETFTGSPKNPDGTFANSDPQPFTQLNQEKWDIAVHTRDLRDPPEKPLTIPVGAHHGTKCEAPVADPNRAVSPSNPLVTHNTNGSAEQHVYLCRDHVMTAATSEGYGVIYLTPNHMVDFSNGEAVIRWDMTTFRTSERDWVDVWITPFDENLQLPLNPGFPDLQGPPRHSVQFLMRNEMTTLCPNVYINGSDAGTAPGCRETSGYQSIPNFIMSPQRRDTFEIRISRTHIKVGMPAYNLWWHDNDLTQPLNFTRGIVQFGHHSYSPEKGTHIKNPVTGTATEDTWHWDSFSISPSVPFTIIKANKRFIGFGEGVSAPGGTTFTFNRPAPANSFVRFSAWSGYNPNDRAIDMRANGGAWTRVQVPFQDNDCCHITSYWTPVPAGTTTVEFRHPQFTSWHSGIKDIAIWSQTYDGSTPLNTPTPIISPTNTPPPTTAPTLPPGSSVILGNQNVGTGPDTSNSDAMNGSVFTSSATGGTLTSASVRVGAIDSSTTNRSYEVAVYSDNNGAPGTLLAKSDLGTLVANSWNNISFSGTNRISISPNTKYWLMYNTNGTSSTVNNLLFSTGSTNQSAWVSREFGTWPTTFGTPNFQDYVFSIYATYTTAGVSPTGTKKLGDVDGDTHVTIADFNEVVAFFGRSQTNPFLDADLDKSGRVWIEDFNEVVANFGT